MGRVQKLKAALKKRDNTSKGKRVFDVDGNKEVNELEKAYQVQQQTNEEAKKGNRMKWTPQLNEIFMKAVEKLGLDEAKPLDILKFMKDGGGAPNDLTRDKISSHLQKIRLKVKRGADVLLRDEIMNTKYHLDLSSSPQQPGTAAGNMCLQPNVGTGIEGTIIQDQALVANNTSLPISSQYKAVDAIETAVPGNGSDDFTILEFLENDYLNSWLNDFSSFPQSYGIDFENFLGADGSLPSSSQDQASGNGPSNTSADTIEGTIIQDQALVANVAGMFNNTPLPSSSQYKAVDANETAMPGNGPNYVTRPKSPDNDVSSSLLNDD